MMLATILNASPALSMLAARSVRCSGDVVPKHYATTTYMSMSMLYLGGHTRQSYDGSGQSFSASRSWAISSTTRYACAASIASLKQNEPYRRNYCARGHAQRLRYCLADNPRQTTARCLIECPWVFIEPAVTQRHFDAVMLLSWLVTLYAVP